MDTIAIIYFTKTGFTKRYADMVAAQTGATLFDARKLKNLEPVMPFKTIVFMGSISAGRLNGFKVVDKNIYDIEHKRIIIVAVGLTPSLELTRDQIAKNNVPFGFEDKIKVFQIRGGFNMNKLGFWDRTLMNSIRKRLENEKRNDVAEEMYQAIVNGADYVCDEFIAPVIEEILHPTPMPLKEEEPLVTKEKVVEPQEEQ